MLLTFGYYILSSRNIGASNHAWVVGHAVAELLRITSTAIRSPGNVNANLALLVFVVTSASLVFGTMVKKDAKVSITSFEGLRWCFRKSFGPCFECGCLFQVVTVMKCIQLEQCAILRVDSVSACLASSAINATTASGDGCL